MTEADMIRRPASRLLLMDESDRVLLFRYEDPTLSVPSLWLPPGGALEDGETLDQCALRELYEETGFTAELGPCVWTRIFRFQWRGRAWESDERFYFLRVPHAEPDRSGWSDSERQGITAVRWWSLDEIRAAPGEVFVPRDLASLLDPLVRGDYPATPLVVGE